MAEFVAAWLGGAIALAAGEWLDGADAGLVDIAYYALWPLFYLWAGYHELRWRMRRGGSR